MGNVVMCVDLIDVLIFDDSQCVLLDYLGFMNIDVKNSSSLNDFSVLVEFSFSSNSINVEWLEFFGVELVFERIENEDCYLIESGYIVL